MLGAVACGGGDIGTVTPGAQGRGRSQAEGLSTHLTAWTAGWYSWGFGSGQSGTPPQD